VVLKLYLAQGLAARNTSDVFTVQFIGTIFLTFASGETNEELNHKCRVLSALLKLK
jgi:hypothetical protein